MLACRILLLLLCVVLLTVLLDARTPRPLAAQSTAAGVPITPLFFDIAVDSAYQRLYASEQEGNRIFLFSLHGHQLETTVKMGSQPRGLDIRPDGQ